MLEDELLTIEDVAAYLKLRPQTIYKWAQQKQIPGAKFGKEWRFKRSELLAWVNRRMGEGAAGGPGGAGGAETDLDGAQDGSGRTGRRPRPAGRKKDKEAGPDGN